MSNEESNDLARLVCDELRDQAWRQLSSTQKEFLSDPSLSREIDYFVLKESGSSAYLIPFGEGVELGMIETDEGEREKGQASMLLRGVCALADKYGVTLSLRAEPKGRKIGPNQAKLVEWYRQFGFEGEWNRMTRRPLDVNDDA